MRAGGSVAQLSFYSAEACPASVDDLAGVLCGPGEATSFGADTAARLSIELAERWRAEALIASCAQRGVQAELRAAEDGRPLVRTAFRADLVELAARWSLGAVKTVPENFALDGVTLRLWALVAGHWSEGGYLLGLDPHGPQTHQPLLEALARAGVPAVLLGPNGGSPAVRVSGARRLARLAELVGDVPVGVPMQEWPMALRRGRTPVGA